MSLKKFDDLKFCFCNQTQMLIKKKKQTKKKRIKYPTMAGFENGDMMKERSLDWNLEMGFLCLALQFHLMFYTHCIFLKPSIRCSYHKKRKISLQSFNQLVQSGLATLSSLTFWFVPSQTYYGDCHVTL